MYICHRCLDHYVIKPATLLSGGTHYARGTFRGLVLVQTFEAGYKTTVVGKV